MIEILLDHSFVKAERPDIMSGRFSPYGRLLGQWLFVRPNNDAVETPLIFVRQWNVVKYDQIKGTNSKNTSYNDQSSKHKTVS